MNGLQHLLRVCAVSGGVLMAAAGQAAGQTASCRQPLATVNVAERAYAAIDVPAFAGRVFVYVPDIRSSTRGFQPFALWVIEGVYGRPFVLPNGPMDDAAFQRIRTSRNVRATSTTVTRSGQAVRASLARQPYVFDVAVRSSRGVDTVTVRVCPAR